jgi:hypothetical protein
MELVEQSKNHFKIFKKEIIFDRMVITNDVQKTIEDFHKSKKP